MSCNQCEALVINGVYCHETGCPNKGSLPVKITAKRYVGILKGSRERRYFRTRLDPTPHYYPEYAAVIGPFKTQRAAKWAAANPCNWTHVSEAETLSKGGK